MAITPSEQEREHQAPSGPRTHRPEFPEWLTGELGPPPSVRDSIGEPQGLPPRQSPAWTRGVRLLLVAALLIGAGYGLATIDDDPADGSPSVSPSRTVNAPAPVRGPKGEPVAAVAEALLPSMVQIETGSGLGSGFVYDAEGFILTAAHVVEGQSEVTVRLASGEQIPGEVVGSDSTTDVAVVRVGRDRLPAASLGIGVAVRVGQLAVAIGSPFGLEQTVTSGVVSAVDRSIPAGSSVMSMIQTDAPINPGNSGGALADRHGRVIGINDSIRSDTGVNAGVGFAIPIDTAVSVADALVRGQEPSIGFLGVSGTEPSSGRAGALITEVQPRTPADGAGLVPGDLITAIDGKQVLSMLDLAAEVRATRPGTRVTMRVLRNGTAQEIEVEIGRL